MTTASTQTATTTTTAQVHAARARVRAGAARQKEIDSVAGGAAALLKPLISAGFKAGDVHADAKVAQKRFELEQRRLRLQQGLPFIPQAQKRSYIKYIFIGIAFVIGSIVILVYLASSTATRTSQRGVVSQGITPEGKRRRVIRRRKKP